MNRHRQMAQRERETGSDRSEKESEEGREGEKGGGRKGKNTSSTR